VDAGIANMQLVYNGVGEAVVLRERRAFVFRPSRGIGGFRVEDEGFLSIGTYGFCIGVGNGMAPMAVDADLEVVPDTLPVAIKLNIPGAGGAFLEGERLAGGDVIDMMIEQDLRSCGCGAPYAECRK